MPAASPLHSPTLGVVAGAAGKQGEQRREVAPTHQRQAIRWERMKAQNMLTRMRLMAGRRTRKALTFVKNWFRCSTRSSRVNLSRRRTFSVRGSLDTRPSCPTPAYEEQARGHCAAAPVRNDSHCSGGVPSAAAHHTCTLHDLREYDLCGRVACSALANQSNGTERHATSHVSTHQTESRKQHLTRTMSDACAA